MSTEINSSKSGRNPEGLRRRAFALCIRTSWAIFLGASIWVSLLADAGFCNERLSKEVLPTLYELEVSPNLEKLTFEGQVRIKLEVRKAADELVLNSSNLELKSWELVPSLNLGGAISLRKVEDPKQERISFRPERPLPPQSYQLTIRYLGKINTQASGLFAVDYHPSGGAKRALFTQFEPADARQFLPCFDEPDFKAQFKVTAEVPSGMMAISNMPAVSSPNRGGTRVEFELTPKMSPYLLFLAVGEFERRSKVVGGTEIGIVTQKGVLDQGSFALESSAQVVKKYNDYFGTKYPLPKLDNVAAPGFSAFFSAMENWGAIFTFEHSLLVDSKISTESETLRSFQTAAHEIAHQWFGNLVTMAWWDDLWLNEGFATWLEGKATHWFHPEWQSALVSLLNKNGAKYFDSFAATHPVVQRIQSPSQIAQAFDEITYVKGRSVLDMLEDYLGEEVWQKGVQAYIQKYRLGNATTQAFWDALAGAAKGGEKGAAVLEIAKQFTTQPGIPLVTVRQEPCLRGKTRLLLEQAEFTYVVGQQGRQGRWKVPVTLRWKRQGNSDQLMTHLLDKKLSLLLDGCGVVLLNEGGKGYYRTEYADFEKVKTAFRELSSENQLLVAQDYFALLLSGKVGVADYLDWVSTLPLEHLSKTFEGAVKSKETPAPFDPYVVANIVYQAQMLSSVLRLGTSGEDSAVQELFKKFWIKKLEPVLNTVGWQPVPGEAHALGRLRGTLIQVLGVFGSLRVREEAGKRVEALMRGEAVSAPSLMPVFLSVVAYWSDEKKWHSLWKMAWEQENSLLSQKYLRAIFSIHDKTLAQVAFKKALEVERDKTLSALLISVLAGTQPDLTFALALQNKDALEQRLDAASVSRFIPNLAGGSNLALTANKLKKYIEGNLEVADRGEALNKLEQIELKVKIQATLELGIGSWLKANTEKQVKKVLP